VTWYGRISSALWTGIFAFALWLILSMLKVASPAAGPWPWAWAVGLSLGLLVVGAALLGLTGLVSLPSSPPIIRSGSKGFAGLALAWMIALAAQAVAAQSDALRLGADDVLAAYPQMLAAGALGGAFILRGRWGILTAVIMTCLAHVGWSYVMHVDFGSRYAAALVPALAPLAAIPLYLVIDWIIRSRTGESAPTGLMA
jgi:hypothetical protein